MTLLDRSAIISPTQDTPLGATNRVQIRSECPKPSKRRIGDSPFKKCHAIGFLSDPAEIQVRCLAATVYDHDFSFPKA